MQNMIRQHKSERDEENLMVLNKMDLLFILYCDNKMYFQFANKPRDAT